MCFCGVPLYVVCILLAFMFVVVFSHSLCSLYFGEVLCLVCGGCETTEDRETVPPDDGLMSRNMLQETRNVYGISIRPVVVPE
jgi:hypothetical protein